MCKCVRFDLSMCVSCVLFVFVWCLEYICVLGVYVCVVCVCV